MSNIQSWHLLPPDLVELQIGQIDLLMAMYPDEVMLEGDAERLLGMLRNELNQSSAVTFDTPPTISIPLHLPISASDSDASSTDSLLLDLTVPFTYESDPPPEEPPQVKVRVQQPPWMNRAATTQLMADLPETDDLLSILELIKEAAAKQLNLSRLQASGQLSSDSVVDVTEALVRVWFYFPSISTRSKRDDFIKFAPLYGLTGFLYAGKPGLLCVEGGSQSIDDYMKFIKTESWGDIPAHHKKVSERYRENAMRIFPDMTEITDSVGERRGQRANRGDMKAVEEWLAERGLGEALTRVLM